MIRFTTASAPLLSSVNTTVCATGVSRRAPSANWRPPWSRTLGQAPRLHLAHLVGLLPGQHLGEHVVEAVLVRHRLRDRLGIAGEHHRLDAHIFETRYRVERFLTDHIGERDGADGALV